jgi:serine/threonine protein kinase HipA of HipAB toxin-antitoxin module
VLGDRALGRALSRTGFTDDAAIADAGRPASYAALAEAVARGEVAGSSAGGEQPKFLATVRRPGGALTSVIVKFTSAETSPVRQRWADLLMCEHVAAQVLERHHVSSSQTQVLDGENRRFLEVERFDRFQAVGRRGLLSLGAIEDSLAERNSPDWNWATAAALLEFDGVIDEASARQLRWRWCFGDLIGNTDMHRSNTSLWFSDRLPFGLTPTYDMLPMLFAPGAQGDLGSRTFSPRPPLPALATEWPEAARAAAEFWAQVIAERRISPEFRVIAQGASAEVGRMIARFG